MKLNMTCETCEFGSNKSCCAENSKKIIKILQSVMTGEHPWNIIQKS